MALVDLLLAKAPEYDPDADPLAKPLPQEATELEVHVELCARRYGNIMRGQHELRQLVVRAIMLGAIAVSAVTKGPEFLGLLVQLLKGI